MHDNMDVQLSTLQDSDYNVHYIPTTMEVVLQ